MKSQTENPIEKLTQNFDKYKFAHVTDQELLMALKQKTEAEKLLTIEILHHLAEVERRRLHLQMGYPSLFEYCTRELNYSEGAAYRRISAMRLTKELPEAEAKLQDGRVNVSTLSQIQRFIRKEEKYTGKKMDKDEKQDLLTRIENKTQQEVERELATLSPHIALSTERARPISDNLTELKIVVDAKLLRKLEKLKSLMSHKKPGATMTELIEVLADLALKKLDPENIRTVQTSQKPNSTQKSVGAPTKNNQETADSHTKAFRNTSAHSKRYIPSVYRQQIWMRDKGSCSYVDQESKNRCGSRHRLEIDHIIPLAGGGKTEPGNLRLLCAAHNRWKANHLHR